MSTKDRHTCLEILEDGSLNDLVRGELAGRRKVKDMFLKTLESLNAVDHSELLSLLLSFVSNLCYAGPQFKELMKPDSSTLL